MGHLRRELAASGFYSSSEAHQAATLVERIGALAHKMAALQAEAEGIARDYPDFADAAEKVSDFLSDLHHDASFDWYVDALNERLNAYENAGGDL